MKIKDISAEEFFEWQAELDSKFNPEAVSEKERQAARYKKLEAGAGTPVITSVKSTQKKFTTTPPIDDSRGYYSESSGRKGRKRVLKRTVSSPLAGTRAAPEYRKNEDR